MKKKLLLVLSLIAVFVCLFAISAFAVDFEVGGVNYSGSGTGENAVASVKAYNTCGGVTTEDGRENVVIIPEYVEYGGEKYKVTRIGDSAFRDNAQIKEIVTPSTLVDIGEHAFRAMTSLTKITINASESFKGFHNAEFYNDSALTYVDLSGCEGLTGIGDGGIYDHTFFGCSKLETVVLPKGITYIGGSAFEKCDKLTKLENIDFSIVTYIGSSAFWGAKIGGDVILSENATYVGDHALRGTNITSFVFRTGSAATQTTMNNATLFGCAKLKYVVLPDNITTIGQHTFSGCSSLEYIVLGANVSSFSTTSTFNSCGALKAIIYKGSEADFKAITGISVLGTLAYDDFDNYVHGTLPSTRTVYCNATTCAECNGLLGEEKFNFTDYLSSFSFGSKCIHCEKVIATEENKSGAMFTFVGFSIPENGDAGFVVKYTVNNEAIALYKTLTGKDVAFGLYAATEDKLEGGDIFDEEGMPNEGALKAEVGSGFMILELKVAGFTTEEQKAEKLALGVYVETTFEENKEYSFLNQEAPAEGDKYFFVSYNDVLDLVK